MNAQMKKRKVLAAVVVEKKHQALRGRGLKDNSDSSNTKPIEPIIEELSLGNISKWS
ncbi:hypothetical protein HPP92_014878, partial [Vanilla planifolia]